MLQLLQLPCVYHHCLVPSHKGDDLNPFKDNLVLRRVHLDTLATKKYGIMEPGQTTDIQSSLSAPQKLRVCNASDI